ncbi:tetratricopeptide repeat protein, partial [bacterium]|nr:tetratricopeptide repeat protein [bacterium]
AYYKIALSYQSNNPLIHYNIGIAYDNVGNDEKALAHLERCIAIEPKHYKAYNALGSFYIKRNNLKQAEYYWRKAIDVNPQFKEGYVNVGSLYANVGLTDQARYFWQKALEIDPNYETPKKHLQSLEKMLKIQN